MLRYLFYVILPLGTAPMYLPFSGTSRLGPLHLYGRLRDADLLLHDDPNSGNLLNHYYNSSETELSFFYKNFELIFGNISLPTIMEQISFSRDEIVCCRSGCPMEIPSILTSRGNPASLLPR